MKHLGVCLLVLSIPSLALANGARFAEARERWLRGNYEEARQLYQELAKDAPSREAAAIGLSRTWQSQGEYDKAQEAIDDALKANPQSADLHARQAELHYLRGRWDDAEKSAEKAIGLKNDHLAARWVRAQVYRDRGDVKKADVEFRWFVKTYTDRSDQENVIKDPEELRIVGLAGSENARWNNLSDQFDFILNEVYKDALKNDKNFWPAKYEAGALLLEKYNVANAVTNFDKVLAINPNAAEALVGKGIAALQKYEVKDAEQFAERALKINPNLVGALALRADVHLVSGAFDKALQEMEQARKINPRDEMVLGRIAACLFLQRKQDEMKKLIEEVEKHDPKAGVFYYVLAESLERRHYVFEAEKYLKKSMELRPMLPWAQNGLGMLYMRLGREKEAREILEKAFKADEFNVRVANTLTVLDHLDKYETIKTKHFELRYDPKLDKQLAQEMSHYLEETYDNLAEKFKHKPKGTILIEVFNNHEMFSGRVFALPDLHTIGACTGPMVAMVSPNGKGIRKPYNWARVLRHEMVHVFNLDQTNFQIPHWFTEGLAVSNEGFPRPQSWNQLLLQRVPKGDLLNLDTVDLGFIRPRSLKEWDLAYCQSQLYVEYLQKAHGPEAISGLLAAYAEGLSTEAAIAKVCKVDKATFEKGYRKHLDEVVRSLNGKPAEEKPDAKVLSFQELKEANEKDPENADVAAQLAEQLLKRDKAKARQLVDGVLAKKKHPLASYVKAMLLREAGDVKEALKLLESAAEGPEPDSKVRLALGKMYFESGKFDKAAEVYERARKAEPHESKWLAELARVYAQTGNKEKHVEVLKELVPLDSDDLGVRKQTARMLLDLGKHAEAERYSRMALEINIRDADVQQMLGEALVGQKKYAPAIETFQLVISIREQEKAFDKADEARIQMAKAYKENGQKKEALEEVNRILARDPKHAEALKLKEQLEK